MAEWSKVDELEYLRTLQDYPGVLDVFHDCRVQGIQWDISADSVTQQMVARARCGTKEFWVKK